ncbi:MAG: enoyl-CoA hydratase/isomerase family protein [Planctomycetales bacterium]|nr:enoyl-CoA hydratase/isomerase family protein [Planctomycetales bacterium]
MNSSSGPLLKVQVHAPAGTIVLNRPGKRNALSREMLAQLSEALDDLHQTRKARAVILTGAGDAFCAGADLAEMHDTQERDDVLAMWHADVVQFRDVLEKMLRFPKPIIAAVNGPALAGGAALVLAADIALACPSAAFGLPEARRGLVAGVAAPLLHFRLGAAHSADLLLTARTIDAAEGLRRGLFQEIVADEQLWARAFALSETIAASAPEALQLSKRMLNETIGEHLFTLLSAGAAASATARTTEAAAEGIRAFVEKREPQWP